MFVIIRFKPQLYIKEFKKYFFHILSLIFPKKYKHRDISLPTNFFDPRTRTYLYAFLRNYTYLYVFIHIYTVCTIIIGFVMQFYKFLEKMPLLCLTYTLQNCYLALQTYSCLQMHINTYKYV